MFAEDMQSYMKQSPQVYFEFSWLVFFINFTIGAVLGLILTGLTKDWRVGVSVGAAIFITFYVLQGRTTLCHCLFMYMNSLK